MEKPDQDLDGMTKEEIIRKIEDASMKLFFWFGLDKGGEYSDAFIAVVARTRARAQQLVELDEGEWIREYGSECMGNEPDVLVVTSREKERIWVWG